MHGSVLLHRPRASEKLRKKKKQQEGGGVKSRNALHEYELLNHKNDMLRSPSMYGWILVAALLFYIFWSRLPQGVKDQTTLREKNTENRPFGTYTIIGEVSVLERPPKGNDLVQHLMKQQNPVVLRNTFVTQWGALSLWDPEYLSEHIGELRDVYIQSKKVFGPYYDKTRPMASLPKIHRDPHSYSFINITAREFWQRTLALQKTGENSNRFYVYYSANVQHIGDLVEDIYPISPLLFGDPDQQNVNVWFGGNGVAAHTHYDSYHNINVQVYGTKRWLLFPPSEAPNLYVFPFLHPSHAQLQCDVNWPTALKRFPNLRNAKAIEVTMRPGDMLYLPPMWFHYVEAGNVSISVNSWSFSAQSEVMQEVFNLPLPFSASEFTDGKFRTVAVTVFLRMLVRKSHQHEGFLRELYENRYALLLKDGKLPRGHPFCSHPLGDNGDSPEVPRHIMDTFLDSARVATGLLQKIPGETRGIWLKNYVEHIISVTNGLERVGAYLEDCLGLNTPAAAPV